MDRVILHCDCNGYFASVECIDRPELKTVPMAVCGDPDGRHGIILAKNELAKAFGVVTAETVWQAKRKCPALVLVEPHHDKYQSYCEKINGIYEQYTDQVEAFSVDESWLDVTGSLHLFGSGREIADTLRRRIREEIGLTISVGVSFNKTFAKLGSDYQKPDATTEITRENFQQILWPLPAGNMLFVGKTAADILYRHGINTIGNIAAAGKELLCQLLGRTGETVWEYACGRDDSPVKRIGETDPVKSVGNSVTFCRDLAGIEDIRAGLLMLCDQVGTRLRRQGLYCTVLQVQIKDPYLRVISRQRKLNNPTHLTKALLQTALEITAAAWNPQSPIRMLMVTASGLTADGGGQTSIFDDAERQQRSAKLENAVDKIRSRFGKDAVQYGTVLHTDIVRKKKRE